MGKKIAMLVGDDFEDSEFRVPYDSLKKAGHEVTIIGARKGETLAGKQGKEKVQAEAEPGQVQAQSFDAMVIPGGYGPDHLRMHDGIVNFMREFCDSGRPVAAVCHGPQLLIEAGKVKGKTMTAWPSVRTDLKNAGANVVDQQVVTDGPIITSRGPQDLQAFSEAIIKRL